MNHKVKFQVSLSDGSTLQEGKGILREADGAPSPWQILLSYMEKNSLSIVSLCLVTPFGQTFNLPSRGKNPKFKAFRDAEKPISYRVQRAIGSERMQDESGDFTDPETKDWYTIAVAVYPSYELQLWVDEIDPRNSWVIQEKI